MKNSRIHKLFLFNSLFGITARATGESIGFSKEKSDWTMANAKKLIRMQGYIGRWVMKQEKSKLDDVLADLVVENCKAMINIVKTAQDKDWVLEQNASALGALYDKISNFSVQILEAAGSAERDSDSEEENR